MIKRALRLLFLSTCILFSGVVRADIKTLAEKEADWIKIYRDKPNADSLVILADIRESRGKYAEALQTWGLLRKTFGTSYSKAFKGETMLTYNQLADWTAKRIYAKRRGIRQVSDATRRQAEKDYAVVKNFSGVNDSVLIDLDGDGLKEMIYYNSKSHGKRDLRVSKWRNGPYEVVWNSEDNISRDYLVAGGEGKEWPYLFITYPDNGNRNSGAGHLYTNGNSWIVIYN